MKLQTMDSKLSVLLLLCLQLYTPEVHSTGLTIAAFNIQVLGTSKMSKSTVVSTLVQILRKYDIVLIQEIRDSSGTAIVSLLNQVNDNNVQQYNMTISGRLGRTSSKEQYAYMYRLNTGIQLLDTYQHPDPHDVYEREPYSVFFRLTNTDVQDIILIGLHSKPTDAVAELDNLTVAYEEARNKWSTDNILILGDLNADCSYVTKSEMTKLLLRDSKYHWWTDDSADTTVSNSDCAYDRFIMTGNQFISSVVSNSHQIFRFDTEYGLSQSEASDVSDHYPIELAIQTNIVELSTDITIETTDETVSVTTLKPDCLSVASNLGLDKVLMLCMLQVLCILFM